MHLSMMADTLTQSIQLNPILYQAHFYNWSNFRYGQWSSQL